MNYLALLSLVALAAVAAAKPCANCYVVQEGAEEFDAAVHLLKQTLANLAATKEGPFFKLEKAYAVAIQPYYAYPTVTADLKDQEDKVERCDVTILKPLDAEDRTTEFKVTFDCQNYQLTRNVTTTH